ncbi:MAG: nucleoside-diphosphate-sugar epimerase [Saprospiraceae bacterium]|jgi:nucleoside-diphosphate-sugar epimerase
MRSVGVIGCGWLGMPLAIKLIEQGYEVHGTTTRADRLALLTENGINGYVLNLPIVNSDPSISALCSCDTYVINIPPGRRNPDYASNYPQRIKTLLGAILKYRTDPRVIFVSSTGVYKNTGVSANESSPLISEKESVLLQAEHLIAEQIKDSIILRMSGLVGPGRHPGKWFAGKIRIPGGNTPINMVHQSDCIELISSIILKGLINGTYNVCADEHPIKQAFYGKMSEQIEVVPPQFQEGFVPYKIVENQKLKERLGFSYKFSDPMRFSY